MLLTIYYRKGCIKSRFLRASLRVMDWDLREADVDDLSARAELEQIKVSAGSGENAIVPAIWTNESYSHEMYCLIEYLNDRSPCAMYPSEPATRLFARTIIHRVLRSLSKLWPEYRETNDPTNLLSYYDDNEELIVNCLRTLSDSSEGDSDRPRSPSFVEMLYFALLIEINYLRPLENKAICNWYKTMAGRGIFADLVAEPEGYFRSELCKLD
ncbi:hypothetical protein ACI77O_12850 [Pseudomonas tritici]|uniref:hypothetical protein n=1 Tax=Pseudomonas tritici TaxID=2745518 RepID=UPI00387B28EA